ncbi:MAG: hypothetical protein ACI88H_000705 [Cocleimonas sp.]
MLRILQMKDKRLAKYRSDRQVSLFRTYQKDIPCHMWSESQLERNTQRYYEYQLDVISFKEQPAQYAYVDDNGIERSYTPDLEITTAQGSELKETKPAIFTRSDRTKERFNHLRALFSEVKNTKYSYITDDEVYAGSTTENLKKIHHFRRLSIANINIPNLFTSLGQQTTYIKLKTYIESLGLQAKHALALLGHQIFIFDYKQPLSDDTTLTSTGV